MESRARRGRYGTSAVPLAVLPLRAHVENLWADFKPRAVLPLAQAVVPVVRNQHITVGFGGPIKGPLLPQLDFISSLSLSSIVDELKP